jgi:hypothetical protein
MSRSNALNRFDSLLKNLVVVGSACAIVITTWAASDHYMLDRNKHDDFYGNTSVVRNAGNTSFGNEIFEKYITPIDENQVIEFGYSGLINGIKCQEPWWKLLDTDIEYKELIITPKIPDIFSYEVKLEKIIINDKDVPLNYFTQTTRTKEDICNSDTTPEYRVNLSTLLDKGIINHEDSSFRLDQISLEVSGEIHLNEYRTVAREKVGTLKDLEKLPSTIKRFTDESYYLGKYPINDSKIQEIAKNLRNGKENVLDVVRACYDYTLDVLTYYPEELYLNVLQAIKDGRGDCDDYAKILVTLCRANGIPAKEVNIGDIAYLPWFGPGGHDWAEVCVPLIDGEFKWILVEPTWGDTSGEPEKYFQCKDDEHLYLVELEARVEN